MNYRTTGIIDYAFLTEISKYTVSPRQKKTMMAGIVLMIMLGAYSLLTGLTFSVLVAVFGVCFVGWLWLTTGKRFVRQTKKNIEKTANRPELTYTTEVNRNGMSIYNHSTKERYALSFPTIVKMFETEHCYLFFTEKWQFVPFFKDQIQDKEAFISFIKGCPTRIKW